MREWKIYQVDFRRFSQHRLLPQGYYPKHRNSYYPKPFEKLSLTFEEPGRICGPLHWEQKQLTVEHYCCRLRETSLHQTFIVHTTKFRAVRKFNFLMSVPTFSTNTEIFADQKRWDVSLKTGQMRIEANNALINKNETRQTKTLKQDFQFLVEHLRSLEVAVTS